MPPTIGTLKTSISPLSPTYQRAPTASDSTIMSFTLTMSGVIVGRSELERRDPSARVASGIFRPGLGYELTEPIFALYTGRNGDAEGLARYREARRALKLQLTDSAGSLVAVREIHIRSDSTAGADAKALVLEVETDDPAVWNASPR